jgi:plastocyanin
MRAFSLIVLLCAVAIPVAGCGGDDDSSSSSGGSSSGSTQSNTTTGSGGGASSGGGGGQTLKLAADPNGSIKFDKPTLSAKAGKVTIVMTNKSSLPHAVEVEGHGVEVKTKTVINDTAQLSTKLKPGKYEFYCPVDGHKAAGMKGTLTVS